MLTRPGSRGALSVFLVLAAAALGTILWFGRGLTFWSDEWAFITDRSLGDPGTWWAPHNEHWSTVAILAYRALIETVGLRSYVPYLLLVAVLHVLVAWMIFRIVDRGVGPRAALAAASVVLFFGAGFENLYWGFQIGFVGAMLAGLVALDALDQAPTTPRAVLAAMALLIGVMTSGVGLFFIAAAGFMLLVEPARRRSLWVVAVPSGAYAAWFLLVGRSGIGVFREPLAPSSLAAIPSFIFGGFEAALGAATGLAALGPGLVVLAAGAAAVGLARGARVSPLIGGLLIAVSLQYALIGVSRAGVTIDQVDYSRYTYVSGILTVAVLALVIGPVLSRFGAVRRTSHRRLDRVAAMAVGPVLVTIALTWNLQLLVVGRTLFVDRASITRALIVESLPPRQLTEIEASRDLILVPAPLVMRQLVADFGSPLADVLVPWAVAPIQEEDLTEARRRIVEGPPHFEPEAIP
ncbi:MAG: hypothetical protein HW391_522 [Chloroflexi bacterium]|nr:hypothetical protein [Chloroflexota bacterium]